MRRYRKNSEPKFGVLLLDQIARVTLPERRHRVQTYTWRGVPLTTALTRFTLGFQGRLERLWEWETLMPKVTPLSQNSHLAIRCTSLLLNINRCAHTGTCDIIADNLTENMQDLYTDNYKMLLTGIKKDLKNKHIVLPDWRTQYYEDSRYPRLICSFRAIQSKFHQHFG